MNESLGIDIAFLQAVCLKPWDQVKVGGLERINDENDVFASHVYVQCEDDFIITAGSINPHHLVEFFIITISRDQILIKEILKGPYYPHNKPNEASLDELIGSDLSKFMAKEKNVRVLRDIKKSVGEVTKLIPVERGIIMDAEDIELRICASEEVPMALRLSWAIKSHTIKSD